MSLIRRIVAYQLSVLGRSSAFRCLVEVESEPWGWDSLHIELKSGKQPRTTSFTGSLEEVCSI